MNETIYLNGGKEFPRKFRKFGDICLSEKDERILVCGLCRRLYATIPDFWKHQRVEHNLRSYEDIDRNVEYAEYERLMKKENTAVKQEEKTEWKSVENGAHLQPDMVDPLGSMLDSKSESKPCPFMQNTDAPILKMALNTSTELKNKPQEEYAAKFKLKKPILSKKDLLEAFDSSPDNDNFDEFITFCCPECGERFPGQPKLWKKHINTMHTFFSTDNLNISPFRKLPDGGIIYKCNVCNVQLNKPNLAPLRRHKLIHMPFKSYNCRLCNAGLRHKSGILHHMRSVHRRGQKKLYSCQKCHKEFLSTQHYQKHMQQHPRKYTESSIKLENTEDCADDTADVLAEDLANEPILPDYIGADYDKINYRMSDEDDDNFDPSPFLITEMTEADAWTRNDDGSNEISFNADVKISSPRGISDDADDGGLWLRDDFNALEQTQTKKHKQNKNIKKEKMFHTEKFFMWHAEEPFKCEVCLKDVPNKLLYKNHLQKHGKNFDCRLCGVKISSIRALRRHYELKRCKAKTVNNIIVQHNENRRNNMTQDIHDNHGNDGHQRKPLQGHIHNNDQDEQGPYDVQIKEEPAVEIIDNEEEFEKKSANHIIQHEDNHDHMMKDIGDDYDVDNHQNEILQDRIHHNDLEAYNVQIKEEPPVEIMDSDDEFE